VFLVGHVRSVNQIDGKWMKGVIKTFLKVHNFNISIESKKGVFDLRPKFRLCLFYLIYFF
jgi:hypothetical protein